MNKEVLKEALGIDVSKDSLSFCLAALGSDLSKTFKVSKEVPNDKQGFKQLDAWIDLNKHLSNLPVIVMEATGIYHEGITHFLYSKGYKVSVLQSGRVKRYAQSLDQRSKTDALDSKMLSMLGCERELALWEPPSEQMEHLRALSRERNSLIKERSYELNRLHAISQSAYQNARINDRHKKRLALLNEQIKEIEKEMDLIIQEDEYLSRKLQYLESIPGISFISAATVVAETLGFQHFYNAKQLTSYAGYDVVLKESGYYRGKSRISKKGNRHIRAVLHMPSMTAVRVNPSLKSFYDRLKPNKAKPLVALVAVQRKLLLLMYSLWKNEMYYDPEYEIKKRQGSMIPNRAG
jgi:transposase